MIIAIAFLGYIVGSICSMLLLVWLKGRRYPRSPAAYEIERRLDERYVHDRIAALRRGGHIDAEGRPR